jgi:predicted DNA-binding transcriptional regulator AlpA
VASRALPFWPRMLTRQNAAAYVDLSIAEFEREVASGTLPLPVKLGNREHWSRVAIDEAVERLAGERVDDWRKNSPLYQGKAA